MTNESNPSATAPAPASRTPWWRLRRRHVVPVGAAVAVVIGLGTTGVAMSAHRGTPMPSGSPPNGASAAGTHECAEATERCDGTLEVPLVWDDPDAEKITVGFSWYPRTDQSRPARGTVFVTPGGPGSYLDSGPFLVDEVLGPVRQRHDVLLVDPRGFGASTPLTCSQLDEPTDPVTDEAIAACAAELGPAATAMTSPHMVADLVAVMDALGVPTVTFYGNSYGTVFGQAFATHHPDRLAGLFLDSVVPTDANGHATWGDRVLTQLSVDLLVGVCARSRTCHESAPDVRGLLDEVADLLRAGGVEGVSVSDLALLLGPNTDPTLARESVAALVAARDGDPAPLQRLTAMVMAWDTEEGISGFDPELIPALAYICTEWQPPYDRTATPAERERQLAEHVEREQTFRPLTPDERPAPLLETWDERCTHWPTPAAAPVVPPGTRHPKIPTLVVAGELDTTTPPAGAAVVAARFPRAVTVQVPFGDHAAAFGQAGPYSVCVRDLMRRFVSDPGADLRVPACDGENLRALGRFPLTLADVPPAASGELAGTEAALVAATHATAADALARRMPDGDAIARSLTEEPGLRGGRLSFDDAADGTTTVHFEGVRYVGDLVIDGTMRIGKDDRVTARLTVLTEDGESHEITLRWHAPRAEDETVVTGRIDGDPFRAAVPLS